jgi:hypothetical protein
MLVDAVRTRLEAAAPSFAGRVRASSDFAEIVETGQMPQGGSTAFVLPLSLRATDNNGGGMAGVHLQMLSEGVGVLIAMLAADVRARRLTGIEPLIDEVIAALAGWTPEEAGFAMAVSRGALIPGFKGGLLYQIDFTCQRQLRNFPV